MLISSSVTVDNDLLSVLNDCRLYWISVYQSYKTDTEL